MGVVIVSATLPFTTTIRHPRQAHSLPTLSQRHGCPYAKGDVTTSMRDPKPRMVRASRKERVLDEALNSQAARLEGTTLSVQESWRVSIHSSAARPVSSRTRCILATCPPPFYSGHLPIPKSTVNHFLPSNRAPPAEADVDADAIASVFSRIWSMFDSGL